MRVGYLLLLAPVFVCAMFIPGEKVPIDRLMVNVKAHFTEYKNQAEAHYLLGRLESLAFSGKADTVEVFKSEGAEQLPQVAFWSWVQESGEGTPSQPILEPHTRDLFFSSVEHYRQAIALDPKAPLYHFSLGWMADQAERLSPRLGTPSTTLTGGDATMTWRLLAIQEYQQTYQLSKPRTLQIGLGADLAIQSGAALIADLYKEIERRKSDPRSASDHAFIADAKRRVRAVRARMDQLGRLPFEITPLIFSARPNAHFADLLSPKTVAFDLDGFTEGRAWPWVQSDTALLVWDPTHEGRIVSGRQLFGSVSWWMFWRNGFEPLAALDNNGDGRLTGEELEGIGVWMDCNGNGISDPGEVTPASEFGIVAIEVHADGAVDGVLASRKGVVLRDGRALTLFDWVPRGGALPARPTVVSARRVMKSAPVLNPIPSR